MNYSNTLCALYTFTEQYDDHDDFPIQSMQGECYKFWDTKALYTIYITSTHIFNISLGWCLSGIFCNVDIYIFLYQGRWRRRRKIYGCSSLHTKLITFEVSVCYNQRSIFVGRRENGRILSYPIEHVLFQLCVCLKWWHSLMSEWWNYSRKIEGIIYLFLCLYF